MFPGANTVAMMPCNMDLQRQQQQQQHDQQLPSSSSGASSCSAARSPQQRQTASTGRSIPAPAAGTAAPDAPFCSEAVDIIKSGYADADEVAAGARAPGACVAREFLGPAT